MVDCLAYIVSYIVLSSPFLILFIMPLFLSSTSPYTFYKEPKEEVFWRQEINYYYLQKNGSIQLNTNNNNG